MKRVIAYFVHHSLVVWLIIIFSILSGILALFTLRSEAFPNVDFHQLKITTIFPGAPPSEVEKFVTIPLEEKIREVSGLEEVRSTSRQSVSEIVVKIDLDEKDPDAILEDVRRAIDSVTDLPDEITERPEIKERKSGEFPVAELGLYGQSSQVNLNEVARFLERELEKIKGVARVDLFGHQDREWHILVNPLKMSNKQVTLPDIIQSIKSRNLNMPAGSFASGPARNIRTNGEFTSIQELNSLPIRSNEIGSMVMLKQIAELKDTLQKPDFLAATNGKPAINLLILKKEKADIVKTVSLLKKKLIIINKNLPSDMHIVLINNEARRTKNRLDVVSSNATVGFILIMLILFIFLTWRDALITSLSLPLVLLVVLTIFPLYDITFNLISMLGIIISIGMLVDNSIVISENIYRHREAGLNPKDAAIKGASELVVPIIGTYLTTVAAFAPMMFMSGIMGRFVWQIPFVVICTLTISLFESFFLLPTRVALFGPKNLNSENENKLRKWFNRIFSIVQNKFYLFVQGIVKKRYLSLLAILLIFIVAIFGMSKMRFSLFPKEGIEIFIIKVEFPPNLRASETLRKMRELQPVIESLPKSELSSYTIKAGIQQRNSQDALTRVGEHLGMVQVYLTPELNRERTSKEIIHSLKNKIIQVVGKNKLLIEEVAPSPPIGAAITLAIEGTQYKTLKKISTELQDFLHKQKGILNIADDYNPGREEIIIKLDENRAAMTGISTLDAATIIRTAYEGFEASKIRKDLDEITLRVLYNSEYRGERRFLKDIQIRNRSGLSTPLSQISSKKIETGPEALLHYDFERAITVTADVDESVITSNIANKKVLDHFKDISLRYPGYTIRFRGEQESTQKSMASLARAGVLALFAIYAILAIIFNNALRPFPIIAAIGLGLIGIVIGFLTANKAISFFAMIGIIGLAGVVVNASIVLADFMDELTNDGSDPYDALSLAAKIRFRPILLTTLTTMAGLLPTAYGLGGSDPVLIPMTLALAWGLASGTFGALIFIPCVFAIGFDIKSFFQSRKQG